VRVLEREEWRKCWRGRSDGGAGEGGVAVAPVLQREGWRESCRGGSGGGAGEGGVLGVLQREEWWECWEIQLQVIWFVATDEERFASFTIQAATPQARVSRSNRTGNTTGRNMQNGPVVPQTALSRPQIHSCFANFGPRDTYSSNMFPCANFLKRRIGC
jgi:hypothetical protein